MNRRIAAPLSASARKIIITGAVLIYGTGFLLWYSATPLGMFPVLDAREIIELSAHIAAGDLPAEPFYRAPLYPALLAFVRLAGSSLAALPFNARLLNGLLHLLSTALVWRVAWQLWRTEGAALFAAALFGLYPVALYFAADALDITLAITLMLAAIERCLAARAARSGAALASAGLLFALATLTRPQMLMFMPCWACFAALEWRELGWTVMRGGAMLAPALLVFLCMSAINHELGGSWRVLPWQGDFNLWAANHTGANGRYFVQRTRLGSYDDQANPARLESERLYGQANPGAPTDIEHMSRYWRALLRSDIAADPQRWVALLASKVFYLVNNVEQYNNKTYAFHRAQSPWLRWNPLCWAFVLACGCAGFSAAGSAGWRRREFALLLGMGLLYAGGLLVTYVSDRFRLPLVPLAAIASGGLFAGRAIGKQWQTPAIVGVILLVSLWPVARAERESTYVQDHLLRARAAAMLGDDAAAIVDTDAALLRAPGDQAALELLCVAHFNAWLRGVQATTELPALIDLCTPVAAYSPPAQRLLGIAFWRSGRQADALARWRRLVAVGGPESEAALAALILVGEQSVDSIKLDSTRQPPPTPLLLFALARAGHTEAARLLAEQLSAAEIARQRAEIERTFQRP